MNIGKKAMKISLIAAMDQKRVIGFQGKMPWHLPKELAYFKEMTQGKPIIMGRKTFESIGKPLPNRRNVVITHQPTLQAPGCEVFTSLEQALANLSTANEVMVIGGGEIFCQSISLADYLYLTIIKAEMDGDTFFPEWHPDEWIVVSNNKVEADKNNPIAYETLILQRKM